MLGVLFALGAAVAWALGSLVARLGLRAMGSINGTFFSMVSSFVFLLAVAVALDGWTGFVLPLSVFPWLALTGVLNFLLGRLFNYMSLGYIGVARATTLFSASPLFASVLAVAFFQERVTPLLLLGTATIILGIALVASER